MKAYKVFNQDWTCRGFQYEVGKTYKMKGKPELCFNGFHACRKVADCFNYYSFNPKNKVAEVELLGDIVGQDEDKQACNKIRIVKELSWTEMLSLANTGEGNSGTKNSGYRNSGDLNSGDRNSGDRNSGDLNSGDLNSGDLNSGYLNSGYRNSGVFCSKQKSDNIYFFNKISNWTWNDWYNSLQYNLFFNLKTTEWISWSNMTEKEKEENENAYVTEGYLKIYDYKEAWSNLWKTLNKQEKELIKELPNFDHEVFEFITGINYEKD